MFNKGQPEINYIGVFVAKVGPVGAGLVGVMTVKLFPISTIPLASNKEAILKIFRDEDLSLHTQFPNLKDHKLIQKFTKEGPLQFEMLYNDGWKNTGFMTFEIYEESKLREKAEFLTVS